VQVTPLGRQLAAFPLAPRFAKMLVLGHQGGCLPYAISMVAALSVENPIVYDRADATADDSEQEEEEEAGEKGGEEGREAAARDSASGKRPGEKTASGKGPEGEEDGSQGGKKLAGLKCRRDLWWHDDGDVMALVKAFGAYAFSNGSDDFAATHGLQPKLMSEMIALARQLQGIITMFYPSLTAALGIRSGGGKAAASTAASLGLTAPPTSKQQTLLRQIALAGLVDNVAKRDPEVRGPLVAYKCLAYDDHIFIHQHSCMRKQTADWVCFLELSETSRVYMKGVTPIQPRWLPRLAPSMCDRTTPLDVPPVRYDGDKDDLICVTAPLYGPLAWELPPQTGPLPDGPDRYKHFARLLLDGKVVPGFASLAPWLNDRPSMLARTWATPKVSRLLSQLQLSKVSTRAALDTVWEANPTFLLKEVCGTHVCVERDAYHSVCVATPAPAYRLLGCTTAHHHHHCEH